MFQVDGGGGTGALARAQAAEAAKRAAEEAAKRAAEEAAKRAAEEAARRAAEEAARRAAEEAARRAAEEAAARQAAESTKAAGTERYAAYAAPDEATAPQAPVEPPKAPEAPQGFLAKMMSAFSLGEKAPAAPVAPPLVGPVAPQETAAEAPSLPTAIQEKVEQAQEQAPAKEAEKKERLAPPSDAERAENAKEAVRPEHAEVFNTLSPEQQQAFRELSSKGRANFDQVFHAVGGMWAEPTKYSEEASNGLRKMLQEHRLEVKDTEGDTLIGTLAKRSEDSLRPEVEATNSTIGILQSAIKQVAYPDRVFQGENTNTCASTALQGIMANEDPAEFLRVATGLVFDGHVKLQSGSELKLDASKVGDLGDGDRSALSDAVQTSFDTFAKQFPPQSDADFGGGRVGGGGRYGGGRVGSYERFGGGRVGLGERFGGGRVGSSERFGDGTALGAAIGGANGGQVDGGGLTQHQIEKLYEKVAGRLAVNVTIEDANRFSSLDGVAAALKGGQKVPVGVQGVDDQGQATHHMISVLGIHKDAEDPGKDKVVFTDPGTGKPATLTVDQFAKIMEAVILPAQYADHMRWNVQPNDSDFGGGRVGGGGRMG